MCREGLLDVEIVIPLVDMMDVEEDGSVMSKLAL